MTTCKQCGTECSTWKMALGTGLCKACYTAKKPFSKYCLREGPEYRESRQPITLTEIERMLTAKEITGDWQLCPYGSKTWTTIKTLITTPADSSGTIQLRPPAQSDSNQSLLSEIVLRYFVTGCMVGVGLAWQMGSKGLRLFEGLGRDPQVNFIACVLVVGAIGAVVGTVVHSITTPR